jgi:hypothetical protein
MSKCECVPGCVYLIEGEKRESERRRIESIDFVLLCNVNQFIRTCCDCVMISELNDCRLTIFLYSVQSFAVIAQMVRYSGVNDPFSLSKGCAECGCIFG